MESVSLSATKPLRKATSRMHRAQSFMRSRQNVLGSSLAALQSSIGSPCSPPPRNKAMARARCAFRSVKVEETNALRVVMGRGSLRLDYWYHDSRNSAGSLRPRHKRLQPIGPPPQ